MIGKKGNKSDLIFVGPNYLKLSESKPIIKKSLHLVSPKGSFKPSTKILYKPPAAKKEHKTEHRPEHKFSFEDSNSPINHLHSSMTRAKLESITKRSKSKYIL